MKQQILRLVGHQQWLRGRDRVLRAFSHPDHQKSHAFETDFFGHSYSGNLANFIDWNVFYYGAFQLHEIRLLGAIADALRAGGKPVNFFDVGANIGHHSLFMSRHADRVFSFEPFSVVRDEMVRKLNHARISNVTIFPVALGDISVPVVRGDDFFAANHLPSITLLKMDVEGYETKVLEGLRETIWRDRPPIFVEIQKEHYNGSESRKDASVKDLLYPDHIIFEVGVSRGRPVLKPFLQGNTEEALVLPAERAELLKAPAFQWK
jgi:hypothetical protein